MQRMVFKSVGLGSSTLPTHKHTEDDTMTELTEKLNQIPDTYHGFIVAVQNYVKKSPERLAIVSDYLNTHPEALTSDVLEFISNQPDFYDDAAYDDSIYGELIRLLKEMPGTYDDFILGVLSYARKDPSHVDTLRNFISNSPNLTTSDVVEFIIRQPDFHDYSAVKTQETD